MLWMTRNDELLISDLPSYNRRMLVSIEHVWDAVRDAESRITNAFENTFSRLFKSCESFESESHVGIRDTMEDAVKSFENACGII